MKITCYSMRARKLIRLPGFDYSLKRYYYFTICVKSHSCCFGRVYDGAMILSRQGNIALDQWRWLGDQYPFIELVSFVIMPDHIHGIIRIDPDYYNHFSWIGPYPKIKPLPELIGAYKTTVSKKIHITGDEFFKWQKSYHEHIIRNMRELNIIKKYIIENPAKWNKQGPV
jgi:putative transposase